MSVLKSLVDWEKSRREEKRMRDMESSEERTTQTSEVNNKEALTSNFEKAKAHKSTIEAAIAEVP